MDSLAGADVGAWTEFAEAAVSLERFRRMRPVYKRVGRETGEFWPLLAGIARVESNHDPTARNPSSGAAGLMQIMPFHFDRLVSEGLWPNHAAWSDPEANVRAGVDVLRRSGLGRKSLRRTLINYMGQVPDDPSGRFNDQELAMIRRYIDRAIGAGALYAAVDAFESDG